MKIAVLLLLLTIGQEPQILPIRLADDSLIASGVYPPGIDSVVLAKKFKPRMTQLFERFETDTLEWIGCFYGTFDTESRIATITDYFEPKQFKRDKRKALADICPGRAIARVHPHPKHAGEWNTCYWSRPDAISFKSAVSYQGYPYLFESIICWGEKGPTIAFWGWNELRAGEKRDGAPYRFYWRRELRAYFDKISQ